MKKFNENRLNLILSYITSYQKQSGKSPTYRQIMKECKLSSLCTVSSNLNELFRRGLIKKGENYREKILADEKLVCGETVNVPLVGECPCGTPMDAIENLIYTVALPVEIFGSYERFILKAKGRSMIKRGIFDGDLMVVKKQNYAENGQTVIARVNGGEATAKVFVTGKKNYLACANDETNENGERIYNDIYPDGEWEICGVVDFVIHSPVKSEF